MILLDMPNAAYHEDPAIGSSRAKLVLDSIQLFRDDLDGLVPHKSSEAQQCGTAFHAKIMQPQVFADMISEGPINAKTGKPFGSDTNAFAEWQSANPGKIVMSKAKLDAIDMMERRMPAKVRDLLCGDGVSESSVFQTIDGIKVKCRPDRLSIANRSCPDLKTISDINGIGHAFRSYLYWFSQEWYKMVLRAEFGMTFDFPFVFAESKPPYRWRIVRLNEEAQEEAAAQVRGVLSMIRSASASGTWADVGDIEQTITWPDCGHYEEDIA